MINVNGENEGVQEPLSDLEQAFDTEKTSEEIISKKLGDFKVKIRVADWWDDALEEATEVIQKAIDIGLSPEEGKKALKGYVIEKIVEAIVIEKVNWE